MNRPQVFSAVLAVSLFSCFLLPPVQVAAGWPSVRLGEILIFGFFAVYVLARGKKSRELLVPLTPVDYCFGLLALSVLVSIFYGWAVMGQPVIYRDYFEVLKPVKYYLFYRLAVYSFLNDYLHPRALLKYLIALGSAAAVIAIMQYFNVFAVNGWLSPLYTGEEIKNTPLSRALGTFGNPNNSGYVLVMLLLLAFSSCLVEGKKYMQTPLFWCSVPLMFSACLLTQSRTALVALPAGILVVAVFKEIGRGEIDFKKLIVHLIITAGVISGLAAAVFLSPLDYLQEIINAFHAHSMLARYEGWAVHYKTALESPFLGWGPAKASMSMSVDNEYLLHFRRYGALGLALLLALYGAVARTGWSLYRKASSAESKLVALFVVGIVAVILLVGCTNSAFNNLRFVPVFSILAGCAAALCKKHERHAFNGNRSSCTPTSREE